MRGKIALYFFALNFLSFSNNNFCMKQIFNIGKIFEKLQPRSKFDSDSPLEDVDFKTVLKKDSINSKTDNSKSEGKLFKLGRNKTDKDFCDIPEDTQELDLSECEKVDGSGFCKLPKNISVLILAQIEFYDLKYLKTLKDNINLKITSECESFDDVKRIIESLKTKNITCTNIEGIDYLSAQEELIKDCNKKVMEKLEDPF